MSRSRRAFATAVMGASTAAYAACSIYNSSLLLPESGADGGALDGGALDSGVEAGAAEGGLILEDPPPRPSTGDGTGAVDVTLAATAFRLVVGGLATVNHPHAPTPVDLDHVWTCPGPPSCVSPSSSMNCDYDGGGDDNAGKLWASFAAVAPTTFNDDGLNSGLRKGYNGFLVRLKDYNGGQNDPQVTVIGYPSGGTVGAQTANAALPKYDGTDVWTIDPAGLLGGTQVDAGAACEGNDSVCVPTIYDTNAYVSGGTVVARLALPFIAGGQVSRLRVLLSEVVFIAPIIFDGTSYRVDEGRFAGRWGLTEFLTSLQSLADPTNDTIGFCGSSASYQNVKQTGCNARDIMTLAAQDGTGATCDAMSLTVAFAAVQAHLGPIWQPPPLAQKCDAGWSDSCP